MQARRSRSRAPLPILLFLVASSVVASVRADGARTSDEPLPSLSAEHVRRHVPSGLELFRARVELSSVGLRVGESVDGSDLEMVQDFVEERLWFVDRTRRIAHEVTFEPSPVDSAIERPITSGGLLATVPCEGSSVRAAVELSHRGRAVARFDCLDVAGRRVASEFLDVALGVVVLRVTPDGVVDELRDLRETSYGPGHFVPPARFRRVDQRELVFGAPAIAAFDEPPDGDTRSFAKARTEGSPRVPGGAHGER